MRTAAHHVPLPHHLRVLLALYCLASLVHFTHNAEYIAYYPNMPAGLSRDEVYLVWLAVTGVGAASLALFLAGRRLAAVLGLVAYGALGLAALGHYALALCSEHTLAMNVTIWFEALTGVAVAVAAARFLQVDASTRKLARHAS